MFQREHKLTNTKTYLNKNQLVRGDYGYLPVKTCAPEPVVGKQEDRQTRLTVNKEKTKRTGTTVNNGSNKNRHQTNSK